MGDSRCSVVDCKHPDYSDCDIFLQLLDQDIAVTIQESKDRGLKRGDAELEIISQESGIPVSTFNKELPR